MKSNIILSVFFKRAYDIDRAPTVAQQIIAILELNKKSDGGRGLN